MLIEVNEKLSGEAIEIPADLVILMVGMEAARGLRRRSPRLVNISQDKDGWFIESHPKLDPVATTTDGIYIAGACQAPKDIPDTVAQARAAAARILGKIAKGKIEIDAVFAEVDEEQLLGLPHVQRALPVRRHRVRRGEASAATSSAPSARPAAPAWPPARRRAIKARHFTDEQIFAQIEGVLA